MAPDCSLCGEIHQTHSPISTRKVNVMICCAFETCPLSLLNIDLWMSLKTSKFSFLFWNRYGFTLTRVFTSLQLGSECLPTFTVSCLVQMASSCTVKQHLSPCLNKINRTEWRYLVASASFVLYTDVQEALRKL